MTSPIVIVSICLVINVAIVTVSANWFGKRGDKGDFISLLLQEHDQLEQAQAEDDRLLSRTEPAFIEAEHRRIEPAFMETGHRRTEPAFLETGNRMIEPAFMEAEHRRTEPALMEAGHRRTEPTFIERGHMRTEPAFMEVGHGRADPAHMEAGHVHNVATAWDGETDSIMTDYSSKDRSFVDSEMRGLLGAFENILQALNHRQQFRRRQSTQE